MPRIMIVDDDPAILRSLRQILEEEGHTVDEAPDGQVALRHFAGNSADLVICDVYMPNMNGIEFVMRVLEAFPKTKIVGLSGGGSLSKGTVLEAAQKVGAVGILEKPFGVEDVIRVVDEALMDRTRSWTDPRDGRHWVLWLERGKKRRVLAFASEQDSCEVEVHSHTPLGDMTDHGLAALLDRARGYDAVGDPC